MEKLTNEEKLEWFSHLREEVLEIGLMIHDPAFSISQLDKILNQLEDDITSIDSGYLPGGSHQTVTWPMSKQCIL